MESMGLVQVGLASRAKVDTVSEHGTLIMTWYMPRRSSWASVE